MTLPDVGDIVNFRSDIKLAYDVTGKRALVVEVEHRWDYVTDYNFTILHVIVDEQRQDWIIDAFEGYENGYDPAG